MGDAVKDEITFLCVNVGGVYDVAYVRKLRNMIHRWCDYPFRLRCLTDNDQHIDGVECVNVASFGLTKWWPKMLLLNPMIRGGAQRSIYFDLDTVILGSLTPLIELKTRFGICANFTRAAGHKSWPCAYGSCVMTFDRTFGAGAYGAFLSRKDYWMSAASQWGDQWVIEQLIPNATILQEKLPQGYMLGYRNFPHHRPGAEVSIAIFAGRNKPHNSNLTWVKQEWN